MPEQISQANPEEIKEFLSENGFPCEFIEVYDWEQDSAEISFRIPGLTGINIPWLQSELEPRNWHIKNVESPGKSARVTLQAGEPYVP